MTSQALAATATALRRRASLERVAALAIGAAVIVVLHAAGVLTGVRDDLVAMGFDPDRAHLIEALVAGAIAGYVAALLTARGATSALAGTGAALAVFAPTFRTETVDAQASTGVSGTFDLGGWLLTVVALVVAALVVGWAAAVLGSTTRRWLEAAWTSLRAVRREGDLHPVWRPAVVVLVVAGLGTALPVFGDMVNYGPDVRMRDGAPTGIPLVGSVDQTLPGAVGPGSAASTSPSPLPSGLLGPASSGGGVTSASRPWLAWRPSGAGQIVDTTLPGPWVGGSTARAMLSIYLPPGYGSSPTRRYPVVYEVPWAYAWWATAVDVKPMLDGLIDAGQVPAEIVVFVGVDGAPYKDTECVNSADGREWIETYVSQTVPTYVDQSYRTIATPAARAIYGFSQGGYCAPMLALRHPDVFGQAIAFSGYFEAGLRTGSTINAWRPFGGDQASIADHSPVVLASTVSPSVRQRLLIVLSSDPTEVLYGEQYRLFVAALKANRIPFVLLPTPLGHASLAVRITMPTALAVVAGRWAEAGVFSGGQG